MWFQKVINDPQGFDGFWMCPTNNCDGAGFRFDIFPTDPAHPANEGWCYDDEESEDGEPAENGEWDASEAKYEAMAEEDEEFEDDDIEGDEWKHGIDPFAPIEETPEMIEARKEMEEREKKYDQPDERPRVLDWKDREDRTGTGFMDTEGELPF